MVLLVPDGNWSRRAARSTGMPTRAAPSRSRRLEGAPSRYGLRRAPHEGALSTLEAAARALGLLRARPSSGA